MNHKKNHIWTSFLLYCGLLGLLIINGCRKDISDTNTGEQSSQRLALSDQELIADAQTYFNSNIKSSQITQENGVNHSVKTKRQLLIKNAVFGASIVQQMPIGKIVTTPINYNDRELYIGNRKKFVRLSNFTFLITYADKHNKKQVEVVTKIPDQSFIDDTSKTKKFSGIVTVEDWHGNFIKGFKYYQGNVIASLGAPENPSGVSDGKGSNSVKGTNDLYCYEISYWSYAIATSTPTKVVNGGIFCCNFIDSELYCTGGGSGSSTNDINDQILYHQIGGGGTTVDPGGSGGCGIATGTAIKGEKIINGSMDQCPPTVDPPILSANLDTSKLGNAPKIKAVVKDLSAFIQQHPNIRAALSYYTGFTTAQITTMMRPGVGPTVEVVPGLVNTDGVPIVGHYDIATHTLQLSGDLETALENSYVPQVQQAVALLTAITTLHEFVHYGRDVDHLSYMYIQSDGSQVEAGWRFEYSISYDGQTGITPSNSITWVNFYPYNWAF